MKLNFVTARRMVFTSALLFQTAAFAVNPVQGWYGGLFLEVSYPPNTKLTISEPRQLAPVTGSLSYNVLGGVGGEIGYRYQHFRLEGELLYNNNPYNQLKFNSLSSTTQNQIKSVFPGATFSGNGLTINSITGGSGLQMTGQTNTGAFLLNGYIDLYTPNQDNVSNIVPYVGAGVGYFYVQNFIDFYYNGTQLNYPQITNVMQGLGGQAIVGSSYFLDDFTTFTLDVRYLKTANDPQTGPHGFSRLITSLSLVSINFGFSGAFDVT